PHRRSRDRHAALIGRGFPAARGTRYNAPSASGAASPKGEGGHATRARRMLRGLGRRLWRRAGAEPPAPDGAAAHGATPLGGRGAMALHGWAVATRTFRERVLGAEGGETGIDDDFVARGFYGVGAWILGRNMFGPVRGPWPDESWTGWWGDEPPFRCPVFVLTH